MSYFDESSAAALVADARRGLLRYFEARLRFVRLVRSILTFPWKVASKPGTVQPPSTAGADAPVAEAVPLDPEAGKREPFTVLRCDEGFVLFALSGLQFGWPCGEVSPAETAVAEAGQSSTQHDLESDDEESLAGGVQASSSYNVSEGCGTTADQGDTTSRFSNGSDSKSQPVDSTSGTEQIVQVPALVQNLTGDPGRGVSVDSPFAHEVPLPFPGSNHTSSMLSINREALEFGADRRTTVMLVKIPKSCQPDRFLVRLRDLNLLTKVRFYYMPMNAARNRPCGYIFLDLEDSEDVVRLCKNLRLLDNLLGARHDRQIQVNFAHIQGWRALLQHFCGSELMFEPDANRRPQFFFPPRIGKSSSGNSWSPPCT